MSTPFTCTTCGQLFRSRTILNNHVRRAHQLSVSITLLNGVSMKIKKEKDGTFICPCSHGFKHPLSLQRHCKKCNGTNSNMDIEMFDTAESYPVESYPVESDPVESELGNEIQALENLNDC